MGTASFPEIKRPGRGADHPPPSKCRGHERVGLYLYYPSGPSWPVMGAPLPLSTAEKTQKTTSKPNRRSIYNINSCGMKTGVYSGIAQENSACSPGH